MPKASKLEIKSSCKILFNAEVAELVDLPAEGRRAGNKFEQEVLFNAEVAELVDALDSKSSEA